MENFAFGNLTHQKGLVPESVKLPFIDKLCFRKLIKKLYLISRYYSLYIFLYIFSYETFNGTLDWIHL